MRPARKKSTTQASFDTLGPVVVMELSWWQWCMVGLVFAAWLLYVGHNYRAQWLARRARKARGPMELSTVDLTCYDPAVITARLDAVEAQVRELQERP